MKKTISLLVIFSLFISLCVGCGMFSGGEGSPGQKPLVRTGVIKGPSGLGMLGLMEKNMTGNAKNSYEFTVAGAPADIQARLINGELDIAAVPTNLAATLYNKTDKDISVISVGTLGVLYLVTKGEEIFSFADLEGKTIFSSGQGASPEYVLNYLINKNGLTGKVSVEYKSEYAELAVLVASGDANIAMLPQPFVTTVTMKSHDVKIALDLNEEWLEASGGTQLAMTCIVVRNAFLKENKAAVENFLAEYKESVDFVNTNTDEAAALSEKFDIIPESVAREAIPKCGIVCITGDDMQKSVGPLLNVFFEANPQSVGGVVPDDAFYYKN